MKRSLHLLWISVLTCALGCQTDFGARDSPVVEGADMTGQAVLFGEYTGLYRVGAEGEDRAISIVASQCGDVITGVIEAPNGDEVELLGGRDGSALDFSFESDAFSGNLTGKVHLVTVLSGTWSSHAGDGGTWSAVYRDGSVDDHPCELAEERLESIP